MAKQRELEELKKKQDDLAKQIAAERQEYAKTLEQIKKDAEENARKLVEQVRDERQSVTNTNNPFKQNEDSGNLKQRIRNDPELIKEIDRESERAFLEAHRLDRL